MELRPEELELSRHQSVLRIHRTGPVEVRFSDLEGDPSLVLNEVIVVEKIVLERVEVERVAVERLPVKRILVERAASVDSIVPAVRVVLVERFVLEGVASCHSIHCEH